MDLIDVIKNFLIGIASNAVFDTIKGEEPQKTLSSNEKNDLKTEESKVPFSLPVESLYAYYGKHSNDWFLPLIKIIHEPNVYIFLEVEPSSFYNLGMVVLEDNRTNDWFPFYKSIALQGSGWRDTERLYSAIKEVEKHGKKVALSLRVANNKDIESLKEGFLSWSSFKQKTVPALTCKDKNLQKLQARFYEDIVKIKKDL